MFTPIRVNNFSSSDFLIISTLASFFFLKPAAISTSVSHVGNVAPQNMQIFVMISCSLLHYY